MHKSLKTYLIFILPLLIKYSFLLIFVGFELFSLQDLFEDIFFCIIIATVLCFNTFNKQVIINGVLWVYILYFVLEGTSYMAVHSNFTSSFMYVLIESSKGELKEFIYSYSSLNILVFIILMILSFVLLKQIDLRSKISKGFFVGFGLVLFMGVFLKLTGLVENNAYHNIVRGTYGYFQLQNNFELSNNVDKEDIHITSDNDIIVIVLGESTTRGHMQLYNYHRETTPNLNACKDSLFVYNDVISTDVITTKSVPKILTSLDNSNYKKTTTNLIEIFNEANYNTYWLSNQRPIGYYDNRISKIASVASYLKFFNHQDEVKTNSYDEVLLPKYVSVLNQEGKKVIFIRLIGTHFDYDKRYPANFNKFKSKNELKKEAIKNHYDNAILYNDFIVYSILKELKEVGGKSTLIYLSDHGENVYDEGDFFGRTESNLKKNMLDIPFFVWTSKSFEFPKDFEYVPNRKFMTDHLYESFGHLFGVKHSSMDFSKSIFSKSFKERKRIVVNGINYDEYFIKSNE